MITVSVQYGIIPNMGILHIRYLSKYIVIVCLYTVSIPIWLWYLSKYGYGIYPSSYCVSVYCISSNMGIVVHIRYLSKYGYCFPYTVSIQI